MHWDNIDWADELARWRTDPANKGKSKPGDDRSPAWSWVGSVYNDGAQVVVPSDSIASCLMKSGAMVPVPGGKNGKTFKAQTQSGMMTGEESWPLLVNGRPIAYAAIDSLRSVNDFIEHRERAAALGFSLFTKRAKVGANKHVRVRPRFDTWALRGTLVVWDDQLTEAALRNIVEYAGRYVGLGDWRPGAPKSPGHYGMFTAAIREA